MLDLAWFAALHPRLRAAPLADMLPPRLRRAHAFMHHPAFAPGAAVALVPSRGGFVGPDPAGAGPHVHYDGLTLQLARVFHPTPLRVSTGGARTGGAARGNAVDREIEALVNRRAMPDRLHPFTRHALVVLRQLGLQPFWAQVPVGWKHLRIATALDVVCVNADGGVVNVQLKTGFDRNYDVTSNIPMRTPFFAHAGLNTMMDSHGARHRLQLLVEHALVGGALGPQHLADSLVLVVSERTHRVEPVLRDPALARAVVANLRRRDDIPPVELEVAAVRHAHAVRAVFRARGAAAKAARAAATRIRIKPEHPRPSTRQT